MNCQAIEMDYTAEAEKGHDVPALAGNFRLLLGFILAFAGLYIATLTNIQGHGLGLLLVLGSPFVVFKDNK